MKRISFFLMTALLAAPVMATAQDAATEERINQLSAQIDVLKEAREAQNKRIEQLEGQVRDLQSQLGKSAGNYATTEDLNKVADQAANLVKEVDKKRVADNEKVLNELEKLGKTLGAGGSGGSRRTLPPPEGPKTTFDPTTPHMEHKVEPGETLSAIVSAYRAKNVKITLQQVLAANPGLKPENMKVGQTIIIPAAGQ